MNKYLNKCTPIALISDTLTGDWRTGQNLKFDQSVVQLSRRDLWRRKLVKIVQQLFPVERKLSGATPEVSCHHIFHTFLWR